MLKQRKSMKAILSMKNAYLASEALLRMRLPNSWRFRFIFFDVLDVKRITSALVAETMAREVMATLGPYIGARPIKPSIAVA